MLIPGMNNGVNEAVRDAIIMASNSLDFHMLFHTFVSLQKKSPLIHPAFEDIKKALFKTIPFGDLLKDALQPLEDKIHFSFIYGSLARGEEAINSDIDLMLIGYLGIRDVASQYSWINWS